MLFFPNRLTNIYFHVWLDDFFPRNDFQSPSQCVDFVWRISMWIRDLEGIEAYDENVSLRAVVGRTIQLCKESFIITI